jgi:hypothetical protein
MAVDPIKIPTTGTAQHAIHEAPVIHIIRFVLKDVSFLSLDIVGLFYSD